MEKPVLNTDINHYIVKNNGTEWQPLIEKGIHYKGIFVKSLHFDESKKGQQPYY